MKKEIINDYVNNYLGTVELSHKYGVHRATIQRYLKDENIILRKKTPKTKVNHYFFSEYNEFSCYWAGFILADGYIRNKKRFTLEIKLQKSDVNHLKQFKNSLKFEGKINEKNDYFIISISSKQIVDDLLNMFDINNNKSLTCFITEKLPKEYIKDFIRGYFDGDGSITYTTTDTINFIGTEKTIIYIRKHFHDIGIKLRSKNLPSIINVNNSYYIFYYGKSAYNCLKYIYENCEIYLDRKYEKYLEIYNKFE